MTIRNLEFLFRPRSVAVIGASNRPGSIGSVVLRNLTEAGFVGPVLTVNPKHAQLAGLKTYPTVASLPFTPELAVVCTPPRTVPALICELGERGTRAAVVLTAGLGANADAGGLALRDAMLAAARPYLLRILGPNCVGFVVPSLNLNASFAHANALRGKIAFVSQSGALITAVFDWAKSRSIGFSKLISLGDCADVDFGDVIDYLAGDSETHAILLYIECIAAARKFMSAARAAARNKPVLVLKAGRVPEGARAAASHTGALAGTDAVYDAAIRRAGMLRVYTTEDLFDTVETLARARPLRGDGLTIVTNGGGPGVLAADALTLGGGRLAELSADTLARLGEVLPSTWSRGNPVDIIGDAPVERYVKALQIVDQDAHTDAVLLIHAPTALVPSAEIAAAVTPVAEHAARNVIGCWLGGDAVEQARSTFDRAGIPSYATPEDAVQAFLHMVQYRRNQELLMQVPSSLTGIAHPDTQRARRIVHEAVAAGRIFLSLQEVAAVLSAYAIPHIASRRASTVEEAVRAAVETGFPVALKIACPAITHKSDVGGVALDLETADAVRSAAQAMLKRVREAIADALVEGFIVQAMVRRAGAHELLAGIADDPVFGPVTVFGQGGIAVEVVADRSIGLPPLNGVLARDMVSRTRVSKLLAGYRDRPPADLDAICRTLIRLSTLAADLPEVIELDINPLLADCSGVLALDCRIRVTAAAADRIDRLSIRPYPEELEEWIEWGGSRVLLRPIRPEDGAQHIELFNSLDPEDIRSRFFMPLRELHASQLARQTQIDYDREMAFIATREREPGRFETLGVVRAVADPDNTRAEFAIVVRSALKGRGLGKRLLDKIIRYSRARGTQELVGETFHDNRGMLALARKCGFEVTRSADPAIASLRLRLGSNQLDARS